MNNTLCYRTSVAGNDVRVRNQSDMDKLFKTLGGKIGCYTDKDIEMIFPTSSAAATFKAAAKANGALFDF